MRGVAPIYKRFRTSIQPYWPARARSAESVNPAKSAEAAQKRVDELVNKVEELGVRLPDNGDSMEQIVSYYP